jgi:hypothetical protein
VARTRNSSRRSSRGGGWSSSRGSSRSHGTTRNLGMLSLALWMVLAGLNGLLGLSFAGLGALMAFFALAGGLLLLLNR